MLKRLINIVIVCFLLSGCYFSGNGIRLFNHDVLFGSAPSSVTVKKGDTLYSISRRYDVPLKDLIEVNGLRPPYSLKVGQTLRMPTAQYHIVKKGDTLYSISRQYNVDVTSLSRKNNLKAPYTLYVGQKLALSGTISGNSRSYQKSAQAKSTSSKKAAQKSYTYTPPKNRTAKFGNELKGFGNLILIKHSDGWITAYAHNDKLLVKKGQKVIKGEKIATVGSTGSVNSPQLHFEVRAGKKAVNPRKYLP